MEETALHAAPYFLQSDRLGFRAWTDSDLELALTLWGDPAVTRWIDARGQLSRDQVRDRLAQEIARARAYGVQYWPIFLLRNDDFVGCCGLRPHDLARGTYEFGVHIRPAYWRRGLATEAATAVIDYAFNRLKVKGLFAGHHPQNLASRHLLEKLGFRYTHDEYYAPTGLKHPSYQLAA